MRQALLGLLLICAVAFPAWADDETVTWGGFGGLSFGPRHIDNGDLSDFLSPINVDFIDWQPVIGVHGYGILGRWVVVGGRADWSWIHHTGHVSGVDLTTLTTQGELGVAALNGRYGLLFPYFGGGLYGHTLEFEKNDSPSIKETFGDQKLRKDGAFLAFGVSYRYVMRITQSGRTYFVGGLHLGGTYDLSDSDWTKDKDNNDYKDGPDLEYTTFQLLFEIGFGGGK